jgi:hydrogenase expression/formation protein HypE
MAEPWPVGKLPARELQRLLARYAQPDERVILGPGIGEDVAVIDFGERYLVAKTDPITFATEAIGWYVVQVNANDVACAGARPRWFLATLLLPEASTDAALVESIFAQVSGACRELGIVLCGGHTEITYGLERPIVVGQMLGEVAPDKLVTTAGVQPGDAILLTKGLAVEGTAIIAREKRRELAGSYPPDFLDRCADFLHRPGISVLRETQIAARHAPLHAMHDPTEGGLATGLWEMAEAADVTLEIEESSIPILPETAALCADLGLDPLGLIASGALLIALAPGDAPGVVDALREAGIAAAVIGKAAGRGADCYLRDSAGDKRPMPRFARDEIARLFS